MHICGAALDLCLDWRRHPVLSAATGSYSSFNRAVATVLTLHGISSSSDQQHQPVEHSKRGDSPTVLAEAHAAFAVPELYASWCHSPSLVCSSDLPLNGLEVGASLLSNGQGILRFIGVTQCDEHATQSGQAVTAMVLDTAVPRAQEMFYSRAYVHQYTAHGLEESDFAASLMRGEQAILNYKRLSTP
eukprot:3163-Heterococcus_DN1.PRE.1